MWRKTWRLPGVLLLSHGTFIAVFHVAIIHALILTLAATVHSEGLGFKVRSPPLLWLSYMSSLERVACCLRLPMTAQLKGVELQPYEQPGITSLGNMHAIMGSIKC